MERYHLRRKEKAIESPDEMDAIIAAGKHMTLAMCMGTEPYLATLNYGYDADNECFYFHCAREGKKVDYLRANPKVWGQIMDDVGYLQGECDHAFRTVQFEGEVEFVDDLEEKRWALLLMIEKLEDAPEEARKNFITEKKLERVGIVRVKVGGMTGKKSLPRKENDRRGPGRNGRVKE